MTWRATRSVRSCIPGGAWVVFSVTRYSCLAAPWCLSQGTSCPFPQARNRLLESGLSWKHEKTGRATLQKQCCRGEARKESELCFSTYFSSFSFKSWQLYFPCLSYGPARRLVTWKIHWVRWFEFLTESMGNILEFSKKLIYTSFDLLVANTLKLHIEVCSSWYTDKFSVNPMIQWHPKLESVSTYRISKRPKEAGPDAVFFLLGLTVFAKEYLSLAGYLHGLCWSIVFIEETFTYCVSNNVPFLPGSVFQKSFVAFQVLHAL